MTLVLGILIAVAVVLVFSWIIAAAATAIVGTAFAAVSGPYSGLRAIVRHQHSRTQRTPGAGVADESLLNPLATSDVHAPTLRPLTIRPVATARPVTIAHSANRDWAWLRPAAACIVIAGVAFFLDSPPSTIRRRSVRERSRG